MPPSTFSSTGRVKVLLPIHFMPLLTPSIPGNEFPFHPDAGSIEMIALSAHKTDLVARRAQAYRLRVQNRRMEAFPGSNCTSPVPKYLCFIKVRCQRTDPGSARKE